MENPLEKLLNPYGQYMTGVLDDNRPQEVREFTPLHEEVFGTSAVSYFIGSHAASRYLGLFPTQNQMGTSSCVAHSRALNVAIYINLVLGLPYTPLAPIFIYTYRSNFPQQGMILPDADVITEIHGVPPLTDLPTPETEWEANNLRGTFNNAIINDALRNKAVKWITFENPRSIDNIAFAVNTLGIAAAILIFATYDEWAQEVPEIINPNLTIDQAAVRHCVTVLPDSAYINTHTGKKMVIIQDSAFFGNFKFRYVSEDFIAKRCYGAAYLANVISIPANNKPTYTFTRALKVGDSGPDVFALQTYLQWRGFMPNTVNGQPFKPTSYFGGMTKTAVQALQNAHPNEILKPAGISSGTGNFGSLTMAFVNYELNQ